MYKPNMTRWTLAAAAFALLFATDAFAQQPGRIRGQIEKADGGHARVENARRHHAQCKNS